MSGSGTPEAASQEAASPPSIDAALGLACTLGGVGLFSAAQTFQPMIPDTVIGPGLLPSICALVFMIFGAALTVLSLRSIRAGARFVAAEDDEFGSLGYAAVLLIGLALVVLLMPYLGFIIASSLYAFAVTWAGRARWWVAALSAVAVTLLVYVLFSSLMRVPLPTSSLF